jgi:radical SAM protein with 4Fe4S-binding SPASM domain
MRRVKKSYWPYRLYRFVKHTTPKRLVNFVLAHVQYRLGVCRVHGLPPLMHIDPVNYCNLHCPLCPTGRGVLGRERGRMSLDLFRDLVDEIADRIYFLNLYNWGEPLLHPQIFDMVAYATGKGLSVRISSNLNRVTPGQARLMVESGLEELLVDFDGATQETYEKYRVGGSLAAVVENIRRIVDVKRRFRTPFPLITARALVMRHNQSEIPAIADLAWSLGVDRFETAPIYVNLGRADDVEEWLPEARQCVPSQRPVSPRKCDQLWLDLTISWDGGVFPCCWFHEQEYDFGNVNEGDGPTVIWNNANFAQSRCFVAGKTKSLPSTICARCKGYPEYDYSYWT